MGSVGECEAEKVVGRAVGCGCGHAPVVAELLLLTFLQRGWRHFGNDDAGAIGGDVGVGLEEPRIDFAGESP